ncbi:MAG: class I SAM-dependent methyltransferase [Paracoccaceae bacterium]
MHDFGDFAARERVGWADERIVSAYVEKFVPVTDHIARSLVARSSPNGKSILDLCCGQGTLTAMLSDAGAVVTGLDFSEQMLILAAKNAPKAELRQGDAGALPFDDDSFEQVVCNFGMMHLPDQPSALLEVQRVLRPGGTFLMGTWAAPDISPAFGTVFDAIKANADFSKAPAQPDLFVFAKPAGADAMMEASGLRVVSHDLVPAFWELAEPEELFEIFLTATVAASQLIKGQKTEVIDAIQDQITRTVREKFREDKGFRVPVPVAVIEAEKQ